MYLNHRSSHLEVEIFDFLSAGQSILVVAERVLVLLVLADQVPGTELLKVMKPSTCTGTNQCPRNTVRTNSKSKSIIFVTNFRTLFSF